MKVKERVTSLRFVKLIRDHFVVTVVYVIEVSSRVRNSKNFSVELFESRFSGFNPGFYVNRGFSYEISVVGIEEKSKVMIQLLLKITSPI